MPIFSHSIMDQILLLRRRLLIVIFLSISASASASISDAVAGHQFGNQRRLLQIKKPCSVNFENQNYTILTSQCSGPDYPPEPCCSGLKDFACPFAAEINDLTTDCSNVMFSYINRVGQYPHGLFSSICREGEEGLQCPVPPPSTTANAGGRMVVGRPLFIALLLLPLQFFVCNSSPSA